MKLLTLCALFGMVMGDMCCDSCVSRLTIYANQLVTTDPAVTVAQTVKNTMTTEGLNFESMIVDAINFYRYTYGVDFSTGVKDYTNPQSFISVAGGTMVALMFNHDKSLNYQVSDTYGSTESGKYQCGYVSTYEVVVFFTNFGQQFGGAYNATHPMALVQPGHSAAYGYAKIQKNNHKKFFMTCGVLTTTSGPNLFDPVFSESDTPEPALYIDLEPTPEKNWGIGESTKRAQFTPAFGPGWRKIVSNIDFPPPFYTGGITDRTCIPH